MGVWLWERCVFQVSLFTFSLSACSLPCLDAREPPLDARRVVCVW